MAALDCKFPSYAFGSGSSIDVTVKIKIFKSLEEFRGDGAQYGHRVYIEQGLKQAFIEHRTYANDHLDGKLLVMAQWTGDETRQSLSYLLTYFDNEITKLLSINIKESDVMQFCSEQMNVVMRHVHKGAFAAKSLSFDDESRAATFARVALCAITCVNRMKEFTDAGVGQHYILTKSYIDFLARSLFKHSQPNQSTLPKELKDLPGQFKQFQNKMSTESSERAKAKQELERLKRDFTQVVTNNQLKK